MVKYFILLIYLLYQTLISNCYSIFPVSFLESNLLLEFNSITFES